MKRKMLARLAAKAAEAELEPFEYVLAQLEGGARAKDLAEELGGTYPVLRRWAKHQPDGPARWEAAMTERAHALGEEILEIVDQVGKTEMTKEEIAGVKVRIDGLKFVAASHNPKTYGNQAGAVNVNLNVGSLHLDAMRQLRVDTRIQALPAPQPEASEADYELEA